MIAGKGRGQLPVKILSNTTNSYKLDQPLHIDATSVWIVESGTWQYAVDSSVIDNSDSKKSTTLLMPTSDYLKKSLLLTAATIDRLGTESGEGDAPVRMIYVFGAGLRVIVVSQDTTLGAFDQQVNVDTTDGPVSITLPPSNRMKGGRLLIFKISDDDNQVTINGATVNGIQETIGAGLANSVTLSEKGLVFELAGNI